MEAGRGGQKGRQKVGKWEGLSRQIERKNERERHIYIYIYAVELSSGVQVWGL